MQLSSKLQQSSENRAVSPVIGVILMVAITVILAAVIGAFVLEIGDQQETAPNASFSSNERVLFLHNEDDNQKMNITHVEVTHAGGDALSVSQTELALDGNTSVWGIRDPDSSLLSTQGYNYVEPQPNFCDTAGGGDASVKSGQSLSVTFSGGEFASGELGLPGQDQYSDAFPPSDEMILKGYDTSYDSAYTYTHDCTVGPWIAHLNVANPGVALAPTNVGGSLKRGPAGFSNVPMEGDKVQMIWEASSGGKTQTLFSYTVQQDSPIAN